MANKPTPNPLPDEPFENIIARIARVPSERIETREFVLHRDPRISANKLAEYVLADPSRQKTIIKQSKVANKAVILPYTKTRQFLPRAFSPNSLNSQALQTRASELKSEINGTPWHKDDMKRSANALENLAEMAANFEWENAVEIHRPANGWGYLQMAGVKVSVQPELVFSFTHRNITKVGAILLNLAIRDEKGLDKGNGSYCVGDCLSSLLFQMLHQKLSHYGAPLNTKCFAVDVFRKGIYYAPKNYRTLNRHMEAACEVIALRWPEIHADSGG